MRMMQVTVHQVVHMIAMRHGFMTAAWAVDMLGRVPGALVLGRTALRVLIVDRQYVLIDMIAMHMMQVAIVQIVDVPVVLDGGMAAAGSMLVIVVLMLFAVAHGRSPLQLAFTS